MRVAFVGLSSVVGGRRCWSAAIDSASPLTVGNGEFGFTADVTGLQTLNATYAFFPPLQTMSHWGWHKIPAALTDVNPPSYHYERVTVGAHTAEWQQCRRWLRRFRAHRRAGPHLSRAVRRGDYSPAPLVRRRR